MGRLGRGLDYVGKVGAGALVPPEFPLTVEDGTAADTDMAGPSFQFGKGIGEVPERPPGLQILGMSLPALVFGDCADIFGPGFS